jgi:hypothetical protein
MSAWPSVEPGSTPGSYAVTLTVTGVVWPLLLLR